MTDHGRQLMRDGTPEWLPAAEEATCAAGLNCSATEVRAVRLTGADFMLRGCGQVWDAILEMETPGIIGAGRLVPSQTVEMQRWVGDHWMMCHPGGLRAHAAMVKRESERRRRLVELGKEAAAVGRGEITRGGGVSVDYIE